MLNMLKLITVVCLLFISFQNETQASEKVIYGVDGRSEVYSANRKWKVLAESTAALIALDRLEYDSSKGVYRIAENAQTTMGENLNLCQDVRFREQVHISTCSGFLVEKDILLTAGHCATGEMADICSSGKYAWVFGYQATQFSNTRNIEVSKENVVLCKKVLKATMNRTIDFAAIKLEKKLNKRPLKINKSKKISERSSLVVIGTPWGLPTKVTRGGRIMRNKDKYFFTAALDTFQGNSGSAVFNENSGEVEGILVRGKTDALMDEREYCRRVNHCDNNGNNCDYRGGFQVGEDVMRMPFVYKQIASEL